MIATEENDNSYVPLIENSEFTDIIVLIRNGKVEKVKNKLIDNPTLFKLKDTKGFIGWTILTYASRISYEAIDEMISMMIEVLLFHTTPAFIKCIANEEDREGYTPIMIATYTGKLNRVKSLLRLTPHIDINVSDDLSKTPLFCAIKNSKFDIAELLLRSGCDKTIKNKV
jgi:ankyrin repeat protein